MKKVIIGIMIGIIITGVVAVIAVQTLIPSSSVTYSKDGEETTVNEALNELFTTVQANNYQVVTGGPVNVNYPNSLTIQTEKKPLFIFVTVKTNKNVTLYKAGYLYCRETDETYQDYSIIENVTDNGFNIHSIWETAYFTYLYVYD